MLVDANHSRRQDTSTVSEADHRTTIQLADVEATMALGESLGAHLEPGDAVGLVGDLGAGKTSMARGIARGLGVDDPEAVTSPTYLIVIEHAGPRPMIHVDAYLPEKTRGFLLDGGVDYLEEAGGIVVAEWADRIRDLLPATTLWIRIEPMGQFRHELFLSLATNAFARHGSTHGSVNQLVNFLFVC